MVEILPRSAWTTRAPEGSRSLTPSLVENVAFHWPGMAKAINATGDAGRARVASALRGWQRFHMDVRGWSDIAYQMAIDQAGRVWTLRGVNIRSGANGNGDTNTRYGAILLILGPGEQPSAAMIASARALLVIYRRRYSRMPVKPTWHGAIRQGGGTACPGPAAIAAIKAGKFNAGTSSPDPTPTPTPTEGSMTAADVQSLKDWIEKDYMPRLYDASKNGTAGKNHQEIERLLRALISQEAGRYQYYAGKFAEILRAQAADDANDITNADVDRIIAEVNAVAEETWKAQVTKLSTPDETDTEAMSSATVYGPERTAELVIEKLRAEGVISPPKA